MPIKRQWKNQGEEGKEGILVAYNLNIIRKLSLNLLKLIEVGSKPLSRKKKQYAIGTNPEKPMEKIMNL